MNEAGESLCVMPSSRGQIGLFAGELRREKVRQSPRLVWASVILPRPLVGRDLYEVGKALADLSDLDQHVNQVCKVLKQSRGDEKRKKQMKGLSRSLESKCGKIGMEPGFLGKT